MLEKVEVMKHAILRYVGIANEILLYVCMYVCMY